MQEGHEVPTGPRAGRVIDEFEAVGGEALEISADVVGTVGDVVKAGTPAVEKSGDRRIGVEGLKQFELPHEQNPNTLGFESFD